MMIIWFLGMSFPQLFTSHRVFLYLDQIWLSLEQNRSKKTPPEPTNPPGFCPDTTIPFFKQEFIPAFKPDNLKFPKTRTSRDFSRCTKSFSIPFPSPTTEWKQQQLWHFYFPYKDPAVCFPQPDPNPFLSKLPGEKSGRKISPQWWKSLSVFDENAKRSIKTELHSLAGKREASLGGERWKWNIFCHGKLCSPGKRWMYGAGELRNVSGLRN